MIDAILPVESLYLRSFRRRYHLSVFFSLIHSLFRCILTCLPAYLFFPMANHVVGIHHDVCDSYMSFAHRQWRTKQEENKSTFAIR